MKIGTGSRLLRRALAPFALGLSMIFAACAESPEPEPSGPPSNQTEFINRLMLGSLSTPSSTMTQQRHEIYIASDTRARLGPDAAVMIREASKVANHQKTVILTPQSVLEPGETPVLDYRLVRLMGEEEMLRRAIKFQEALKAIPGLNYNIPDFPKTMSGVTNPIQMMQIEMAAEAYHGVIGGNTNPLTMRGFPVPGLSVIVMPDSPDSLRELLGSTFEWAPQTVNSITRSDLRDWYFLILLHEAAHVSQPHANPQSLIDMKLTVLRYESEADKKSMEEYFRLLRAGTLRLNPAIPGMMEDFRAVLALNNSGILGVSSAAGEALFDLHATNSSFDIRNNQVVAENVQADQVEIAAAILYVNSMAFQVMLNLHGFNSSDDFQSAGTLMDDYPLLRYSAIKHLMTNGHIRPNTIEHVVASEYLEAIEERVPGRTLSREVKIFNDRIAQNAMTITPSQVQMIQGMKDEFTRSARELPDPTNDNNPFRIVPPFPMSPRGPGLSFGLGS